MLLFKACPKCRGDLQIDRDEYGDVFRRCVQCGLWQYLDAADVAAMQRAVEVQQYEGKESSAAGCAA